MSVVGGAAAGWSPVPGRRPAVARPAPVTELVEFGHLTVAYDERVLRPRAWTVAQARWAASLLPSLPPGAVLEVCAGTGHIGLLATEGAGRWLVQVDAGEVACRYARLNADHAGRADVEVRHATLADAVAPAERFALVVADPPWVPSAHTGRHPEDPLGAIDGGDDGLDLARACLDLTARHLLPGGAGLLQTGPDQVPAVAEYAGSAGLTVEEHRVFDRGALVLLR